MDFFRRITSRKLWVTILVALAGIAAMFAPMYKEWLLELAKMIGGFLMIVLPVVFYLHEQAKVDAIEVQMKAMGTVEANGPGYKPRKQAK